MTWLYALGLAVVAVAVSVLSGAKPEGTRPIRSTRMMAVGRVLLGAVGLLLALGLLFHGLE